MVFNERFAFMQCLRLVFAFLLSFSGLSAAQGDTPVNISRADALPERGSGAHSAALLDITLTDIEIRKITRNIYFNEASSRKENLLFWNDNENFLSLGIAHFIWYPAGRGKKFSETFPELVRFFRKSGIDVPVWVTHAKGSPWKNRDEFLNSVGSKKYNDLLRLMDSTKELQTRALITRLSYSLDKILKVTENQDDKDFISRQFYRVSSTEMGYYALVDYVNFKGEGIKESETYLNAQGKPEGWGLKQVLENMKGNSTNALREFAESAQFVLNRRVKNSPPEKNEQTWLKGWTKRITSYVIM
ncbi:hypothetical protein [Oceanospirillum sediminis]|uniref:Uncharacterized protein n=1 Tax=Oceanospirillum sediminis TaxID=2760088 RepID=A0A839IN81_9GAMM|nr:hypothetical protein [Oceanospirillum sediminis]MBB1485937.1 hypothetical protein [Oceanospirillum sediminis]